MKLIWLISSISVGIIILIVTGIVMFKNADNSSKTQSSEPTSQVDSSTSNSKVAGEYWCRSYNYNGAGGSCQLQRPLILNTDGSYSFGITSGKYTSSGDKITFDGGLSSRGSATYTIDKEIIWEFSEKGASYTITYYLRSEAN